jgi:hypothetical protein
MAGVNVNMQSITTGLSSLTGADALASALAAEKSRLE